MEQNSLEPLHFWGWRGKWTAFSDEIPSAAIEKLYIYQTVVADYSEKWMKVGTWHLKASL